MSKSEEKKFRPLPEEHMQRLVEIHPELAQLSEFNTLGARAFDTESDRAKGILIGEFTSYVLMILLKEHMEDTAAREALFMSRGALDTFSARAHLAHALGLIDNTTYHNANIIRKIRNEFAHNWKVHSFAESPISEFCRDLNFPWESKGDSEVDYWTMVLSAALDIQVAVNNARAKIRVSKETTS